MYLLGDSYGFAVHAAEEGTGLATVGDCLAMRPKRLASQGC